MRDQGEFRAGLRHYRKNLRISQGELAALAGVSRPTITNFETGHSNLSVGSMERVRKALLELIRERAMAVGFFPASPKVLSPGVEMQVGM
jgi:predicted transcriptional regulator